MSITIRLMIMTRLTITFESITNQTTWTRSTGGIHSRCYVILTGDTRETGVVKTLIVVYTAVVSGPCRCTYARYDLQDRQSKCVYEIMSDQYPFQTV